LLHLQRYSRAQSSLQYKSDRVACDSRALEVGEASQSGSRSVGEALRLARCWQARSWLSRALVVVDVPCQQNTRPSKQFTSTFALCLTLDTLIKTSLSILHTTTLSLVKAHPSRHSSRQYPLAPARVALSFPGAPYNAIVRSARRHISLRVHSSLCIPSIPRPNTAIRHHVFGVKRSLA
jgi:hypothetical protein